MNRQEFVAEILSALGGRNSSDETVSLTVGGSSYNLVHEWIYRAERRIATRHDFMPLRVMEGSLSTTADSPTPIDLPAYTKSVIGVRIIDDTSSYEVVYQPPMWFDLNRPYPGAFASGKPSVYTIKPSITTQTTLTLQFDPIPDDVYILYIDLTKWPAPMSSDTDVSDFGEYYLDHVILEYALGFGFLHRGEAYKKDADYHFRMGDKFLEEMIAADDYVPAYRVSPEGYRPARQRRGRFWDLDSNSFPSGTTSPYR